MAKCNLVLSGGVLAGRSHEAVATALAQLLKVPQDRALGPGRLPVDARPAVRYAGHASRSERREATLAAAREAFKA